MPKRIILLFLISLFINMAENIILLLIFGVKFGLDVVIGSGVFALIISVIADKLIYKENSKLKSEEK